MEKNIGIIYDLFDVSINLLYREDRKMTKVAERLVCVTLFIICLSLYFIPTEEVLAVNKKTYTMSEHTISKFLKSKRKLTIIVDKGCLYSGNYRKKLNISKISFKVAKNCKWKDWNIGYYNGNGSKYRNTSYVEVKREIEAQRDVYIKMYEKFGEQYESYEEFNDSELYSSPVGLKIVVKNDKIVKVIALGN